MRVKTRRVVCAHVSYSDQPPRRAAPLPRYCLPDLSLLNYSLTFDLIDHRTDHTLYFLLRFTFVEAEHACTWRIVLSVRSTCTSPDQPFILALPPITSQHGSHLPAADFARFLRRSGFYRRGSFQWRTAAVHKEDPDSVLKDHAISWLSRTRESEFICRQVDKKQAFDFIGRSALSSVIWAVLRNVLLFRRNRES